MVDFPTGKWQDKEQTLPLAGCSLEQNFNCLQKLVKRCSAPMMKYTAEFAYPKWTAHTCRSVALTAFPDFPKIMPGKS